MRIVSMQKGGNMRVKNNVAVACHFLLPPSVGLSGHFSAAFENFPRESVTKFGGKKSSLSTVLRVLRLIKCLFGLTSFLGRNIVQMSRLL